MSSTSPTSGSSAALTQSIITLSGLASGINTSQLVTQLMQINEVPQQQLKSQQAGYQTQLAAYQDLNTQMLGIGTAAAQLAVPSGWQVFAASSSNSAAVNASAGSGAVSGTLSFNVNNLASAASVISSASVSSTSATVASGHLLLSAASGLGFAGLKDTSGGTLATGAHTLTVTQSSTGASVAGTAVAGTTTVTAGVNDTLGYTVDGTAKTLTLAAGSYSASQLAVAVQTASGGALAASVNGSGGLTLSSVAQGSAHSLSVTGGNALASLGLTAGASGTGTDGIVSLDGGPAITVSDASAGATITLTSGTGGTLSATLGGGLTAGSSTLRNVSSGTGSLSDVVNAINAAGAGMTAAAVQVSPGSYRLQLTSTTTGSAAGLTVDPGLFNGALGSFQTVSKGTDATVTVGTGAGAYQVTSHTNSITGLMPGVTLNLLEAGTGPVTVTVGTDANALATQVNQLITQVNQVISASNAFTNYDPNGQNTGPLLGDMTAQRIPSDLQRAITAAVGGSVLGDASAIGIGVNRDGTISFDQSKFVAAVQANPSAVEGLFVNGFGSAGTGIAQRLQNASDAASASQGAYLTSAISGVQAEIRSLGDQIAAWQPILDEQQQMLQTQFTNMETMMAQLQSQGGSLALALNSGSSGSSSTSSSSSKGTLSTSSSPA